MAICDKAPAFLQLWRASSYDIPAMFPDPETPIEDLMNLGPASKKWLHPAGVRTLRDLQNVPLGVLYEKVKRRIPRCNSVFLYAVLGALTNCHWNSLPPDIKRRLRCGARIVNEKLKRERADRKLRPTKRRAGP